MVKIFTVDSPFENNVPSPEALARQARKWEAAEVIDYVLCGYSSLWPHNLVTSPLLFAESSRVKLIVAHRPGVMHPAAAARCFATMDVMSGARLAINFVTGSSDKDVHREGDYADKATRYERAGEYVEVMKRCWSEPKSFDYQGEFYRAEAVRQLLRPLKNHVPVFMGGDSDAAIEFGARHADTYMLWGEPLAGTRERIERVLAAAEKHGRKPEFSLSLRLFLGDTDEAAWAAAHAAEDTILAAQGSNRFARSSAGDTSVGRERQLSLTNADVHDDCFWSGLVKLLGGFANSAALNMLFTTAVNGYSFTGFLDALASAELSDVQAEPSTTTIDNRKASLFAGNKISYLLTPPIPAGQITPVAPQIATLQVGIQLDVTPHVTANRNIAMELLAIQQTLLGITGSGKSATIAWTIEQVQKPTLVIAPNKSLAAQLANEFREFFPENRVEYFVSYYDYYQPEAYLPSSDTYIEKDSSINDEIDRLRHSATAALLTRRDVIVVASVSCIYGMGNPEEYRGQLLELHTAFSDS